MNEEVNFTNKQNRDFYRSLPLGQMNSFVQACGLSQTPELDLIWGDVSRSPAILELGAGEGRIIEGLLSRGYRSTIYAVERDQLRINLLRKKFDRESNVNILERDILRDDLPRAHTGLWLWSGITELNPSEQKKALQKLSACITDCLVLDLMVRGSKTYATFNSDRTNFQVNTQWGTIDLYLPSKDELVRYLKETNFRLDEVVPYRTDSGGERELYLLRIGN